MARFNNEGDARIENTSFAGVASAGTIALWLMPSWNSGDSAGHNLFDHDSAHDAPGFQKFSDNNIYCGFTGQRIVVSDAGLFTSGTWAHWALTWSNAAGQTLYKNGVSVGTNTLTFGSYGAGLAIGSLVSPTTVPATNTTFAEYAYWSAILDAAELSALVKGYSPLLIRPASQQLYYPLIGRTSPEIELISGLSGTVQGTVTAAAHPRIIMPSRPMIGHNSAGGGGGGFQAAWARGANTVIGAGARTA
jgi:hypothetical protein